MKSLIKSLLILSFAVILPLAAYAEVTLNEMDGKITGTGYAKTHDFPVVAEKFEITISDVAMGKRTISFKLPVDDITTDNGMRDVHMKMSLFKTKEFPNIEFMAETDFTMLKKGTATVIGFVTINGIKRPLNITMSIDNMSGQYKAHGSFQLHPTDFDMPLVGMGPMKLLNKVDLNFEFIIPEG